MKAVILAAGRGRRMGRLTDTLPKPLISVLGKPIIHHIIESLPPSIDHIIVVIGYQGNKIKRYLKEKFPLVSFSFVRQDRLVGPAYALLQVKDFFTKPQERFILIYGDELPSKTEIKKCLSHNYSCLCHFISKPIPTGVVKVNKDGMIIKLVEHRKPTSKPVMAAGGVMVLNSDIFNYRKVLHQKSGEYYLTPMLNRFNKAYPMYIVLGQDDLYFTTPADIERFSK
ncbi:MAG: hypothetical protein A2589_02280 [Candidatus Vogelbacteria bacterium RIFOXYD1_FULL_46_19]|uniref:Nucleotidyl transferase domain-containing protein n=1 Tax=Candidatus Vogelbacteria bacterium RIFOXYD1_FULL_46_19 TaxID=1802439 RepID=A0A1G2QI09_9BACT|nr:MAG: hypothetical protein A2589_02280 [Candidatus Vogelbacteria bacterium RIFOXYD1_FULL_46_19]